jgi:hypothetical protein
MKNLLALVLCLAAILFAAEPDTAPQTPAKPEVEASVEQVPVDVMQEELAMRDSVMQVRDSLCAVEKDSLRKAIVVEEAKCANWEQSYQTMKQNNEVCAQALGVALDVNEKGKEKVDDEKRKAATMTGTSFLGGLGVGLLVMWLIMR